MYAGLLPRKHSVLSPFRPPVVVVALVLIFISGCASAPHQATAETITLEGEVMARGQAPFSEYVLETEAGNLYVLRFADEAGTSISTPSRMRVIGRLYSDDWDGRPFAHVQVEEWERAP